uniref:Coiled-coil domain-containing protein n=1 Tax=Trypanosoma congolense (strain IL3000) TaxID=1068625 RepID=G0V067_TRYCI|nr:conserved hypothetical protein [Trypanosoma congolense IL3000]
MPSGPKSNKYTNRHAAEARERDQERRDQEKARRQQETEDALWADNDAKTAKKQAKQREAEEKAQRQAEQRALKKELLLQEERELSSKVPVKVTRRQMQKDLSKMLADYDKGKRSERGQGDKADVPKGSGVVPPRNDANASSYREKNPEREGPLNEALSALQLHQATDQAAINNRHIGKRARVLYRIFCDEQLPALREEKPGLRRSQYNDLLWEMWQKSPSNPFVQRSERQSAERLEQERRWLEGDDEEGEEGEDEAQE